MSEAPEIHIPSSGTPHPDFDPDIELESWEPVEDGLKNFLNDKSAGPSGRIVLGEWGKGKTHFSRLLKKKLLDRAGIVLEVSTPQVLGAFETDEYKEIISNTSNKDVQFLIALFKGIKDEAKENSKLIPEMEEYSDPEKYIEESLSSIINEKKDEPVYLFIDEFEEILEEERAKNVISGIKGVFNNDSKPWGKGEDKKFGKYIRFIFACTPDAYDRISHREGLENIFGGFERRMETIELPVIGKQDSTEAIKMMIEESYGKRIDQFNPFSSDGVINTLVRVGRGNLGNIQQMLAELQSSSSEGDWNYNTIFKVLPNVDITSIGGKTKALIWEEWTDISSSLGDEQEEVLKLLLGELKPHTRKEISEITGVERDRIPKIIEDINKGIEKPDKPVIRVSKLEKDKLENLLRELENIGVIEINESEAEKNIRIGDEIYSLSEFENILSFVNLETGRRQTHFPLEEKDIQSFFEGVSTEFAELMKKKAGDFCEGELYAISELIKKRIYPAPIPGTLNFILDPEKRYRIWRDVRKNLKEYYIERLPSALLSIAGKRRELEIIKEGKAVKHSQIKVEGMHGKIKTKLYPFFNLFDKGNLEDIKEEFDTCAVAKNVPFHIALLLTNREIPSNLEKIMEEHVEYAKENLFCKVKISNRQARRILAFYQGEKKSEKGDLRISSNLFESRCKDLVEKIGLMEELRTWIDKSKEKGKVIEAFRTPVGPSQLVDAYKFFINFREKESSVEEIYQMNEKKLDSKRWFGKRMTNLPDYETSDKLNTVIDEMERMVFVVRKGEKYSVSRSPVEERVMYVMDDLFNKDSISKEILKDFFLYEDETAHGQDLFERYLEILEAKGFIQNGDMIERVKNLTPTLNQLRKKVGDLKRQYNREKIGELEYILVSKERGFNLVSIPKLIDLMNDQIQIAEKDETEENEVKRAKIKLLDNFLEHIEPTYFKRYSKASKKLEKYKSNLNSEDFEELHECLVRIKNQLGVELGKEEIQEYNSATEKKEKILNVINKESERSEIENLFDKMEEKDREDFHFQKSSRRYNCSPRVYQARKEFESIKKDDIKIEEGWKDKIELINQNSKEINSSIEILSDLKSEVKNINLKVRKGSITEKIKTEIESEVESLSDPQIEESIAAPISIGKLKKIVKSSIESLEKPLKRLDRVKDELKNIKKDEDEVESKWRELMGLCDKAQKFFKDTELEKEIWERVDVNWDENKENLIVEIEKKDELDVAFLNNEIVSSGIDPASRGIEQDKTDVEKLWKDEKDNYPIDSYRKCLDYLAEEADKRALKEKFKVLYEIAEKDDFQNIERNLKSIRDLKTDIENSLSEKLEDELGVKGVGEIMIELFGSPNNIMNITQIEDSSDLKESEIREALTTLEDKGIIKRQIAAI